ncbi:MAG TPA: hypothetical protein VD866_22200 [Urbifossiella sp.]|nr:hypothetical protein [Urbifossiella sp.]
MGAFTAKATSGSGGTEKAPAGNHPAILVAIVDMGTQQTEYQGTQKWQRRGYFVWELVTEKVSGTKDRNHVIALDLAISLNEKAKLRKFIESRTGKKIEEGAELDVDTELGQKCLLGVVSNAKGYPRVETVSAVPKGLPFPEPQTKPFAITLAEFRGGTPIPDWVPYLFGEPLADVIARCKEIAGDPATRPVAGGDAKAEDIPF